MYAKRVDRGAEFCLRKRFPLFFNCILDLTTRFNILQNVGDFRSLARQCIEALKNIRESERYTKGLFCWIGFEKNELIFNRCERVVKESHWSFWTLFNLAIEGIMAFTVALLRFASIIGTITVCGSFVFMVFLLLKLLLWEIRYRVFTILISVMLFLYGIQLLTIGIWGEYIGRIFNETKSLSYILGR